ncbi:MAG: 1-deoxy-D-xylulose-5-phosphate reductoisomerase [Planctomycetota bacterium]|jgi:1-deoxy-D-xylulose-5-phosphate reductoisomerase
MADTGGTTRRLVILGATGSIGRQAIRIVEHLARLAESRGQEPPLRIVGMSAGSNAQGLLEQAESVGVSDLALDDAPADISIPSVTLRTGPEASATLVRETRPDIVLGAIVGMAGLPSVLSAVEMGIDVAIANKESLVAGGALVTSVARRSGARLLPVDSEHAALWQCLARPELPHTAMPPSVRKLIITASGGPFREWDAQRLDNATPDEALNHPTWSMGPKNTIDSASLMNKALELIEAHWLFDAPSEMLDVHVQPDSLAHAIVQHHDGSSLMQFASPTMLVPIQQALTHPGSYESCVDPPDLSSCEPMRFEPVDSERFPAVDLAHEVIRAGGMSGAIFNAANESAVEAFLQRQIPFGSIVRVVEATLRELSSRYSSADCHDLCALLEASDHARARARERCASPGKTPDPARS